MNIQTAVAKFLNALTDEVGLSNHTINAYKSDLSFFVKLASARKTLQQLTPDDLSDHIVLLRKERGLAPTSLKRHAASLRRFILFVVKQCGANGDLAGWRPHLARPRRLPRPVSRTDVRRLLSAGCDDPDRQITVAAMMLMVATGLRIGEICSLKVCDIDGDGRVIHVFGKGSRERVVYATNKALRGHLRRLTLNRSLDGPLFRNQAGHALSTSALRRRIKTITNEVGIVRRLTPHMFRHSAATWHLEAGTDIRVVQRLLGHASISTTEIYTQVADRHLELAIQRADVLRRVVQPEAA